MVASLNEGQLSFDFVCRFVNDTLYAIGLRCNITPAQIEAGNSGYLWPREQLQAYVFQRIESEFRRVEQFLETMSRFMADVMPESYQDIVAVDGENETRDVETPIEFFMQMIVVWYNVYKDLLSAGDFGTANMFVEPLARISCVKRLNLEIRQC